MSQCVYLLHFESKLHHAQHYIGWSSDFEKRMAHHLKGTGARITRAVSMLNINIEVARKWEGADGNFERKVHNYKKSKLLCPICSGEKANERMKLCAST